MGPSLLPIAALSSGLPKNVVVLVVVGAVAPLVGVNAMAFWEALAVAVVVAVVALAVVAVLLLLLLAAAVDAVVVCVACVVVWISSSSAIFLYFRILILT